MSATEQATARPVDSALIARHTRAAYPADWTDLDTRAVSTVRVLAADAVQKAGNGHPGTAISLAPLAYTLFQRVLRHDPADPGWVGRDRFVLSCGHASLFLYIQLYLGGFGLEIEDIEQLRVFGSLTPGHPEYRHTKGVEMTTGPLGQGLAHAVGMAYAARRERGLFDPSAPEGSSPFDHHIYVVASDGDIEEGVTSEASSLAGTQQLGNLVVVYDRNHISIEDDTEIAFTEDVGKRYEAYGWQVLHVDSGEDVAAIEAALHAAKAETGKPSIIILRSIIGYPSPKLQNTGAVHGAALGAEEVAALKRELGFDPERTFQADADVIAHTRALRERGAKAHERWSAQFQSWAAKEPERKQLFDRLSTRELPAGLAEALPTWEVGVGADGKVRGAATRKASGDTLNALAPLLPELWGGSADLAGSNNTTIKGASSFGPTTISTEAWSAEPYGRVLHFGIREHAMAAILGGIVLHGPTRAYGGTFLQFSDYMRPSVRLASLMEIDPVYIWTHDSIGLGEDGPTHQPIEHLAALRAIPHLNVVRPGDPNETAYAWLALLNRNERATLGLRGPVGLILTRQDLPVLAGTSAEGVAKGAYILAEAEASAPQVLLIGTGSELQLAVAARAELESRGVGTRVVSAPSLEWFEAQDEEYRAKVLPPEVKARVAVEAGIALSWRQYVGDAGETVSIEHYGASGDAKTLFREFGFTSEAVVEAALRSLSKTQG